jgi:hypothetical protein
MNISRHRDQRRGVVLLIVVSLLALFILLGITYSLAVSHYVTASKIELQQGRLLDQPETEADLVFGQILYDTAARTVLQYHSLLMDLYGSDSVQGNVGYPLRGNVLPATPNTGSQFYTVGFTSTANLSLIPNY